HLHDAGLHIDAGRPPRDPSTAEAGDAPDDILVHRAAHPDRYAPWLPRLRHHVDLFEAQQGRIEGRPRFAPQRLAYLERVIEKATSSLELEAGRLVLFTLPADSDTEIDTSIRQYV